MQEEQVKQAEVKKVKKVKKARKPKHVDVQIGTVKFNGKEYRVIEFTNQSTHVEPCPDCCFGSYTHIGKKQMKLKGVVKTVTEGSFVCKKPDGFFHCTAVSRNDGKNVYYKSSLSHTKKN